MDKYSKREDDDNDFSCPTLQIVGGLVISMAMVVGAMLYIVSL